MFNRWRPYPKHKPKKKGWYQCSIQYGKDPDQAYVMDLYWNDKREMFVDNRRFNVFQLYEVYGYGTFNSNVKTRMYSDSTCFREDVIAFKRLPKLYKKSIFNR